MYYYAIYKITNLIDNKFYIGSHKTKNLDDNYMGSGKYLKYAQEKYGMQNFIKEILHVFDNPEEMYKKEAEIVNEDFLSTQNSYNLKIGGFGGWDFVNNIEQKQTLKRIQGHKSRYYKQKQNLSEKSSFRMKKLHEENKIKYDTFIGKFHTDNAKKIIAEKNALSQAGIRNSQYGSMWITDGTNNKKIKKNDVIPEGWKKGRVIKNSPR